MRIRTSIVLLGLLVAPLSACSFSFGESDEEAIETDSGSDSGSSSKSKSKTKSTADEEETEESSDNEDSTDTTVKKKKKAKATDEDALEASVAAALQTNLAGTGGGASGEIGDAESACMAKGMIEELGAERVIELGLEDSGELILTRPRPTRSSP